MNIPENDYKNNNSFYDLRNNFVTKFLNIQFKGLFFTFILLLIFLAIFFNVYRSVSNALNNRNIYFKEYENYQLLKIRNESLQKDREFFLSDDYKLIFLRETQNLVKENEFLYSTRRPPVYIQERKFLINLKNLRDNYWWWYYLLTGSEY